MTTTETDLSNVNEAVAGIAFEPPQEEPKQPVQEPPEGMAFDRDIYIEVPVIDGHTVDEIAISFSGTIKYDANDEYGKSLLSALRLGKPVELRVGGFVNRKPSGYRLDKDGEPTVTGAAGVKIETVRLLRPEDLS